MFRLILVALLLPAAPALAQEGAPRVVVTAGFEWSSFANAAPLVEDGQTTTAFMAQTSGVDLTLGAEVRIIEWFGVGVAHERLAGFELSQAFEVDGFRDFTTELDTSFDPAVTEIYAAPSWPVGDSVRVSGMVGVGFWRAEQSRTVTLLFQGEQLSSETLIDQHDGASLVVGAGLDVWFHRHVGLRAGYKYLSLSSGDIDEPVHNLRVLGLFGF